MLKLNPDEKLVKVIRKHWFLIFLHISVSVFLFIFPIILLAITLNLDSLSEITSKLPPLHPSMIIFVGATWALFLWLNFFGFWTDHYLDGLIITDKRIVDVEQRGFFSRKIASFRMERIQDVSSSTHGIIATLLKFGEIRVQTAGNDQEFILKHAPDPRMVRQIILDQHDKVIEEDKLNSHTDPVS